MASSSAARTAGSSAASAAGSASAGTRVVGRSTPSNRAVCSRTAAAPRARTSAQTGATAAIAAITSSSARGSTPASFALLRPVAAWPRRSIRGSTRPVYERRPRAGGRVHMADRAGVPPGQSSARTGPSWVSRFRSRSTSPSSSAPAMMPAASGQSAIALRAPSDSDALRCRGRQRAEQVMVAGLTGMLADGQRDQAGRQPAEQHQGHPDRVMPAYRQQVAGQPGDNPANQADQAVPAVPADERARLGAGHLGRTRAGHHQVGPRGQRRPEESGGHPQQQRDQHSGQETAQRQRPSAKRAAASPGQRGPVAPQPDPLAAS